MNRFALTFAILSTIACGGEAPVSGQETPSSSPAGPPGAPVLFFSDLTGGPREGNSDTTFGQSAGTIVTVWGRNLGSTRGTSTVTCGGAPAAAYYAWGNATAPANLYASHGMQMVSFQVSNLAAEGPGEIRFTVGGVTSNPLPFLVRSGAIRFVRTSGSDATGIGSWTNPWRTIVHAKDQLAPGDICYVGDGVSQTTITDVEACVNLSTNGTPTAPKALVAYPGATVQVGASSISRAFHNWGTETNGYTNHWTVSKMRIVTGETAFQMRSGWRVAGNYITAPNGDGVTGVINVSGSNVAVLGNELTDCGDPSSMKYYHAIYVQGTRASSGPHLPTESNRDVGWNYLHDNRTNRGINLYSEEASSAFIEGHRIHDNRIVNQRGDGILVGYYVTGTNWVYNNVLINTGLGPNWPDDTSTHVALRFTCGHEELPPTTVHCSHNTIYGGGYPAVAETDSGMFLIEQEAIDRCTLEIRNNIVRSTGQPYLAAWSGTMAAAARRNLWFGAGPAPVWDTTAISVDPLFVNAAGYNVRPAAGSPAIDAGVSAGVTADADGVARPQGSGFDLGAYESH